MEGVSKFAVTEILRIDPPILLDTPKGLAEAHFLIERTADHDLEWVCFIQETAECWMFQNPHIRQIRNITAGRVRRHQWSEEIINQYKI